MNNNGNEEMKAEENNEENENESKLAIWNEEGV